MGRLMRAPLVFLVGSLVVAASALACGDTAEPPPVEKIVTVTVEVEKIVEVPVEVEKIVEVERIVQATPTPAATEAAETPAPTGPAIYKMGLFEDPISRNIWNYLGGPAGSVWTGYVISGYATQLYGYSAQRFDWVPVAADGFPTPLGQRDRRRRRVLDDRSLAEARRDLERRRGADGG